jgi:hypothetical protein
MRRWFRYRRALIARTLRQPQPLFVLDPQEMREALEGSRP